MKQAPGEKVDRQGVRRSLNGTWLDVLSNLCPPAVTVDTLKDRMPCKPSTNPQAEND